MIISVVLLWVFAFTSVLILSWFSSVVGHIMAAEQNSIVLYGIECHKKSNSHTLLLLILVTVQ